MIKNDLESYQPHEGKLTGIYRGVVEDNKDPKSAGRCRVRIFGVHTRKKRKDGLEGIPTEEIIWAEPALSLFEGSVSGYGSWTVPLQGSHVFVFFEAGHPLQPRFFASVPGIPSESPNGREGFNDPDEQYPDKVGEPDYSRLARNEDIDQTIVQTKSDNKDTGVSTVTGSWDEPEPFYSAEYPHNKVIHTHSGIVVEIDDTEESERVHVYHPSNSYIEINSDGSMVVRNALNKFEIVDNDKKEHVVGDYDRTVDGNRTSKVSNNEDEEVGGNQNKSVTGNENKTVNGDRIVETSGKTTNTSQNDSTLNGANVNLNKEEGTVHSIVTTGHICPITGNPHPYGSPTCFAHLKSPTDTGTTN